MSLSEEVKGKKFVVYDDDNNAVAKGWIMDANNVTEKVDVTCKDNGKAKTHITSTTCVITGHITHFPYKQHGMITYHYKTFWDWLSSNKTPTYTPIS